MLVTKEATGVLIAVCLVLSCNRSVKFSVEKASATAADLVKTIDTDVGEVRRGLPEGAKQLAPLYRRAVPPQDDLKEVREALERARNKVQDLRVAKSTFFALADQNGSVLRNDQEQDLMAGKQLFGVYPELRKAISGSYVESRGSLPEAAAVAGRADGQWVAAHPVVVDGQTKGLYVTGWSWSAYAYRLENAARSSVRSEGGKQALVYVYVLADDKVYGAPISPEVNAQAISEQNPLSKIQGETFTAELEITDRDFGLAVRATPALGPNTGVAVLRSET